MSRLTRWCALVAAMALGWTSAAAEPHATQDAYQQIQAAFLQEQFPRVVELVEPLLTRAADREATTTVQGIADAGQSARVRLWYVLSLDRVRRSSDALDEMTRLKRMLAAPNFPTAVVVPLWPEVLLWEGEISRKAGQIGRARLAYQRLFAQFPKSSWATQAELGLALILFDQHAYDVSLALAHQIIQVTPGSPAAKQALLLEGLCQLQLRRFDDAATRFQELLAKADQQDTKAQLAFYLGEALSGLERFPEAAQVYGQAQAADPDSLWARLSRFGIGWSEFQQHHCRDSATALGESPDPAWPRGEWLFAQGECAIELGNFAQALARLTELQRSFPQHPLTIDAALSTAELLEQDQRVAEGVALLEPLLRQPLTLAHAQQVAVRLGELYLAQGRAEDAMAKFREAETAHDLIVRQAALNGAGDAQAFLGHLDDAARRYEQAFKTNPATRGALYATYQLGRLQLQAGSSPQAIEAFQWVAARAEGSLAFDAHLAMAFACLSTGQSDCARRELDRASEHASTVQAGRVSYYAALLALRDGDAAATRRLCDDVLQRAPRSSEAFEAQLLLADVIASEQSAEQALTMLTQAAGPWLAAKPDQGRVVLTADQRNRLLRKLGDFARQSYAYARAIAWYEQARDQLPAEHGELDYLIASCYEEAGDMAVAISRYQAVAQPWAIRGQLAAAKLLEREQRWQDAMTLYRVIMREGVPEAKIAEERLASLSAQSSTRPQ